MFSPTPAPPRPTPRRSVRRWLVAAGLAVMAGAGATLIVDAGHTSGAPLALAVPAAPPAAGGDSPVEGTTTTTTPATTTTSASPPATAPPASPATATPPPPPTARVTTTSRPRPAPAPVRAPTGPPSAAPAPAPAADADAQLQQVEAIADTSGWDWRAVHVHFRIAFDPEACCHWGVYDQADHKTIWIGPTAFGDATRLRYVVLHELGHAWQWHTHRLKKLEADMAPWGYADLDALEAGADCIAADWGASVTMGHYWSCPPDAQALMARRLAGQWT